MLHAERETTIARPPREVFAFLADKDNDRRWRPGVLDLSRESGEGVGARYRQGVKGPLGRRIPADIEITAYRPDELIAFRALAGPVRPEGRFELAPAGGGTRVRFSLEADLRGPRRLMAGMVRKTMESEVGSLERLKRVLEAAD